jgi:membrane fusion protein (multidrug efflux system)
VAGTVATINFDPGQIVEERALLVELDASVERAQLDSAKARGRIAQSNFNRVREAAAARAVTPSELDEAEAQLDQAEAEVAELEAVIERKTLRAPFRAKIGLADTHKGQFLPSGYQIASLQSVSDFLYVDFMIPQSASDTVQVGQPVQLLRRDQRLTAEVVALDSQANRDSRNLLARAKLAGDIESLVPGDSVKVLIEYGEEQTTAAVPVESLQTAPMHTYVFVVESDAGVLRARKRTVVAGPSLGSRLSITTGLAVGEQVVADGGFKLRDGAMITPSQDDESPKES